MVCFSNRRCDAFVSHQVVQGVIQRTQVGIDFLHQVAGQESQPFTGFDSRAGQHQALHGFPFQGIDGAGDRQPGLACAGGADSKGNIVLLYLVQVFALMRRARAQVGFFGAQTETAVIDRRHFRNGRRRGWAIFRLLRAPGAQLHHAKLDIVDRQSLVHGSAMKPFERLAGCLGLFARDGHPVAAAIQDYIPAIGDLAQVFIQRSAQIGQVGIVAVQLYGYRRFAASRPRHANPARSCGASVTISPFSVLVMACTMRTSTICPIRRGWPTKLTMRLFSLRPANSAGSRLEGFSTSMR